MFGEDAWGVMRFPGDCPQVSIYEGREPATERLLVLGAINGALERALANLARRQR